MFTGFKIYYPPYQFVFIFLLIIIGVISVSLFGSLIASLGLLTRDINMLLNGMEILMILLSGVNIPISRFPTFLKYLSQIFPLSHLMESLNLIIQDKISMAIPYIVSEIGLLIMYFLLGQFIIKFLERKARHIGNIDLY
ncbi:MAG: ABC transporter permease [Dictyoglomaceae bacterium]|uniref:ABC transporter permease n=1 Tax=Dictyoglomus thermophilum TaxID=14 RepID=UPI0021CCD781|nr:ABC transporter permease [Dictyoglomus thermophilum]MCX7942109.1 ABC transporter permease [Dictyoglomaceae bacterium]